MLECRGLLCMIESGRTVEMSWHDVENSLMIENIKCTDDTLEVRSLTLATLITMLECRVVDPPARQTITFGKHIGKPLGSLSDNYLRWVASLQHEGQKLAWANLAEEVLKERNCDRFPQLEQQKASKERLDSAACAALLRKCGNSKDLLEGKRAHTLIVENGHAQNTFVSNLLVQMYGRCGCPELARRVFDNLSVKNAYSWTMMILTYTQNGHMQDALQLYRQMDVQQVKPSVFLLSGILAACLDPKDLPEGKIIHAHVLYTGCESDVVVATSLVKMYSRCGSLESARVVFEKMPNKDVVAWTTMVVAYAQNGHPLHALELYKRMNSAGMVPNMYTFASVLGACSDLGGLEEGREIHSRIVASGLESTVAVQNALVDMYAKCGSLEEARDVFDKMERKDLISWSAMITGYSQHEHALEALDLYRRMNLEGVEPDMFIFASVLGACSSLGALAEGKPLHARMLASRNGLESDVVAGTALVSMYAKCKSLEDARSVFDKMPHKDVVCWTTMIVAYAQEGHPREAVSLYKEMVSQGEEPDTFTYASVLGACSSLGSITEGKQIHARNIAQKTESDPVVQNALLNMYLRCASLEDARSVFDKMLQKTPVSVTIMITAYTQEGHPAEALRLYHQMDSFGAKPDTFIYASALGATSTMGALAEGKLIHARVIADGLDSDFVVQNALVNMYSKCGSVDNAESVFKEMRVRDVVSWTALITGYAQHGHGHEALELFWEMNLESFEPDDITFTTVLQACSHLGLVDEARDYLISMNRDYRIVPVVEHYVGMVDVLGRAGWLNDAEELVNCMPYQPTAVAWTTLLGACKIHSDAERAKRIERHVGASNPATCMLLSNIYAADDETQH